MQTHRNRLKAERRIAINRHIETPNMFIVDTRQQSPKTLWDSRFWHMEQIELRPANEAKEITEWIKETGATVLHFQDTDKGCIVTALTRKP